MTAKVRRRMLPEDRRAQLVEAATRLISQVGYRQFTLAELARECGITRAAVVHHFASREEILLEVLTARDLADVAALSQFAAEAPDGRAVLDLLVRRNFHQPEIVRLYTVLSAEALDPDHPAHAYFRTRQERALRFLGRFLTDFEHPREVAVSVHAVMDGLQLAWLRDPSVDFERQWARFADTLFRAASRASVG